MEMVGQSLISKILGSVFFSRAMGRAGRLTKSSALMLYLAQEAFQKAQNRGVREGLADSVGKLKQLIRLVRAYASGEYRGVELRSMVTVVGVIIYFVSPLDLIPDLLPVIGVADDIALMMWLFNTMGKEMDNFTEWEKERAIKI